MHEQNRADAQLHITFRVYLPRLCFALHRWGLHRLAGLLVRPVKA